MRTAKSCHLGRLARLYGRSQRAPSPWDMPNDSRSVAIGMVMIAVSGVLFSIMSVFTRIVTDDGMSSMQIVFFAGIPRYTGLAISVLRSGQSPLSPRGTRKILLLRSLCGMTAYSLATYAFGVMPIGDATTIFQTSPVWAAVLGYIILKEVLRPIDVMTIVCALVGVVLVARPESLFGATRPALEESRARGGLPGEYAVLVGAVFAGSVSVLVRLLKKRGNVHPAVIAHAYAFVSVTVSPLGLLLPGQGPRIAGLRHPVTAWSLCLLIGLLAIPNQLLVNAGLLRVPAALGSTMRLIDVPCAFAAQVLWFGQTPDASSVVGAALICLCTIGSAYRKWHESTRAKPERTAAEGRDAAPISGGLLDWARRQPLAFGRLQEEALTPGVASASSTARAAGLTLTPSLTQEAGTPLPGAAAKEAAGGPAVCSRV